MSRVLVVMMMALVALAAGAAAGPARHRDKRATEEAAAAAGPVTCQPETPCGWTVYTPFTKTVEYFMKNDYCNCSEDRSCNYYDDDISIGAFVHRCLLPTQAQATTAGTAAS